MWMDGLSLWPVVNSSAQSWFSKASDEKCLSVRGDPWWCLGYLKCIILCLGADVISGLEYDDVLHYSVVVKTLLTDTRRKSGFLNVYLFVSCLKIKIARRKWKKSLCNRGTSLKSWKRSSLLWKGLLYLKSTLYDVIEVLVIIGGVCIVFVLNRGRLS